MFSIHTVDFCLGKKTAKIIEKPRVIEVETLEDGTVQSVPPISQPRRTMVGEKSVCECVIQWGG